MVKFEMRLIERTVKVFQVEANSEEEAEEIYQESDEKDTMTDSWPIDSEVGEDWHEIK